jgi:hypothetical protein
VGVDSFKAVILRWLCAELGENRDQTVAWTAIWRLTKLNTTIENYRVIPGPANLTTSLKNRFKASTLPKKNNRINQINQINQFSLS